MQSCEGKGAVEAGAWQPVMKCVIAGAHLRGTRGPRGGRKPGTERGVWKKQALQSGFSAGPVVMGMCNWPAGTLGSLALPSAGFLVGAFRLCRVGHEALGAAGSPAAVTAELRSCLFLIPRRKKAFLWGNMQALKIVQVREQRPGFVVLTGGEAIA